ncbi:MAG: hypothetical protein GEV08_00935 [Acidimicrobiia bacterium]|nr:hypothetical protein [Acidimicrobiia bacterium]
MRWRPVGRKPRGAGWSRPTSSSASAELRRVLAESRVGTEEECERAEQEAGSFGRFVRGLVGLDRAAAKEAFASFLDDKRFNADQIEFVSLVIDELSERGVIEPRRFYESPFTDISSHGPDALFKSADVDGLIEMVHDVRRRAEVA